MTGLGKDVPYEKWSRESFRLAYEEADKLRLDLRKELDQERAARKALETTLDATRVNLTDLKTRLHAAESSNQYMRGYLARVQEDDTVREELVTMGDPEGEQRMVPKRKPTTFERPDDFTEPKRDRDFMGYQNYEDRNRKPKHWITY